MKEKHMKKTTTARKKSTVTKTREFKVTVPVVGTAEVTVIADSLQAAKEEALRAVFDQAHQLEAGGFWLSYHLDGSVSDVRVSTVPNKISEWSSSEDGSRLTAKSLDGRYVLYVTELCPSRWMWAWNCLSKDGSFVCGEEAERTLLNKHSAMCDVVASLEKHVSGCRNFGMAEKKFK